MQERVSQSRAEWNYFTVLLALVAAVMLQSMILQCACHEGVVKSQVAFGIDALVLLRLVVARVRRETGRGWVAYALLPLVIIPVIEIAAYIMSA